MTSRYDDFSEYRQPNLEGQDTEGDCFELLSAYIDGETTALERQQVEQLLDNDPEIKKIYLQLLKLQGEMQNLAFPPTEEIASDSLSEKVFAKLERSNRHRKLLLWGGGVIASTLIAAISGIVPGFNTPGWKLANSPVEESLSQSVMVAVTLNQPTVTIPKTAISTVPLDLDRDYK